MAPSSKFYDLNILFEQVLKSQKLWYVMNSEIKILVAFINNALNSKMVLSKLSVSMNSLTFWLFMGNLAGQSKKANVVSTQSTIGLDCRGTQQWHKNVFWHSCWPRRSYHSSCRRRHLAAAAAAAVIVNHDRAIIRATCHKEMEVPLQPALLRAEPLLRAY